MPRQPYMLGTAGPPADTLIVDCTRSDGAATWSHWPNAPALPAAWQADTSTGQVLCVLQQTPSELDRFAYVANDHLDTDGVLSVACAVRGTAVLTHADIIEAAAEAGDFTALTSEAGLRLHWRLVQCIQQFEAQAAPDWQQQCLNYICAELFSLIDEAACADPRRDAAWANVERARLALKNRDGIACEKLGDVISLAWPRRHEHAWDQFLSVPDRDDWPLPAVFEPWPETAFHLHAEQSPDGTTYVLYAPGHSWANTVTRPHVPWPNCQRAQTRLTAMERNPGCQWIIRPQAQSVAFVAQIASVDAQGRPAPSSQSLPTVAAAVREAVRSR